MIIYHQKTGGNTFVKKGGSAYIVSEKIPTVINWKKREVIFSNVLKTNIVRKFLTNYSIFLPVKQI